MNLRKMNEARRMEGDGNDGGSTLVGFGEESLLNEGGNGMAK